MFIQDERVIKMSRNFVHIMELDKKPLPVDIEKLIDKFGVLIIFRDFPNNFDALLTVKETPYPRPLIIANSAKPQMRIRFSLAHEFGHYLLPWHYWDRVYLGKRALHFESEYHLEIEANMFAGEILMPFEKFYPLSQDSKVSIEELSDMFKTSIPAVRKRYETIIKYYQINGSQ